MTADQPTDAEVRDLAKKVENFAGGLSPKQQELFAQVLARGGGLEDVKGYTTLEDTTLEPFQLPIYDIFASVVGPRT